LSLPITPTFILPYKRYACPTLLELAAAYVDNDHQSYRQTVRYPGSKRVIGYQTPPGAPFDERALNHATVWRMLTWLGCQLEAFRQGLGLIMQHDPGSRCHRFLGAVAPHKFRSRTRGKSLRQSRRLLHLINQWQKLFPEPFFPRFATRSGFS
jgi:hypothetical protein